MTALVQTLTPAGVANAVATSSTFTMGSNFSAGNSAVVSIAHYEPSSNRISGVTIGGTAASREARITSGAQTVEIWHADSMTGGTADFVITYSGGAGNYVSCGCEEWTPFFGVDTPTLNTASGASSSPSVATSAATSQNVEVCYAVMSFSDAATPTIAPPGSPWVEAWENQNGSTQNPGVGAYVETTTTGTQTATWATSGTGWVGAPAVNWFAAIVSYYLEAVPVPRIIVPTVAVSMR